MAESNTHKVFPESVSEGSLLNLGHHYFSFFISLLPQFHYFALTYLILHFLLLLSCASFISSLLGYGPRGLDAKVTMINMVWRTPVLQMTIFIMPVRGLIQTEQFLIWFGEHMFSKS